MSFFYIWVFLLFSVLMFSQCQLVNMFKLFKACMWVSLDIKLTAVTRTFKCCHSFTKCVYCNINSRDWVLDLICCSLSDLFLSAFLYSLIVSLRRCISTFETELNLAFLEHCVPSVICTFSLCVSNLRKNCYVSLSL